MNIVAITPVWNEPLGMIQEFSNKINEVRQELNGKEIGFTHLFLDDGALNLPVESSILVRHKDNLGLAETLVDGYRAIFSLKAVPDIVVRLDCQEHDPWKIITIVDSFSHTKAQAIFLPAQYWTKRQKRPLMRKATKTIAEFCKALSPMNPDIILATYNQEFPMGYQAWRTNFLKEIFSDLENGLGIFEKEFSERASWGFDLLAILLAAQKKPAAIDFSFGGWPTPWEENRGPDKVTAQRDKAEKIIKLAKKLGCQ